MEENKPKLTSDISKSKNQLTLLDVIIIFLRKKKYIFISTGIICIVNIIIYFFILDLIFYSSAVIKSSGKGNSLLSALEGSLPDISGLDDLGIGGGGKSAKELASYEEILTSRRCIEPLIDKFDLINRDEFRYREDAIKDFIQTKLIIKINKLSGAMEVGVYDKNKAFAKEMVEFLLAQLDKINIELSIQNAKNNREFIERRYFQSKEDLTKAEDSLKSYQFIYGIAPDLQIKASAQSVFGLEAELKSEEVKLDVIRKILASDQPEVKLQEAKVNALKDKISGIQTSTDLNDYMRLGNSPQIAMSFLRLTREVEIQTKILTFLLPLYEQAKIEEKRETPTIVILDKPIVAERKEKPKRLTMVIVFTVIGFFLSWTFFVIRYKWTAYKVVLQQAKGRLDIS